MMLTPSREPLALFIWPFSMHSNEKGFLVGGVLWSYEHAITLMVGRTAIRPYAPASDATLKHDGGLRTTGQVLWQIEER